MANQLGLEELTDAQMEARTGGSLQAFGTAYAQGKLSTIAAKISTNLGIDLSTTTGKMLAYGFYQDYAMRQLTQSESVSMGKMLSVLSPNEKQLLDTLYKA